MGRLLLISVLGGALAATGCGKHLNPAFCATHANDPDCAATDAGVDGTDSNGCTKNEECASDLCLPDGACAPDDEIFHVAPTGSGVDCSASAPCMLQTALGLATPQRHIALLAAGTYQGTYTIDRSIQLIGVSAVLDGGGGATTLTVEKGAQAELDYMTIQGGALTGAISCESGATLVARQVQISDNMLGVASSCALTIERSILARNFAAALSITGGVIDIHSNFIVNNGHTTLAGAVIAIDASVTGALSWNTVAFNKTGQNREAIECAATLPAVGNLVTDNNRPTQVSGSCDFTASYTMKGTDANDLMWVNPAADTNDFHLTAGSPPGVVDNAGSACDVLDFDGMHRPAGSGCDFGADELGM